MIISLIVIADEKNGIGKNNGLLCHLPADLRYFKQTTTGHHIVMGRRTFEAVGRPLPNRVNMVITRDPELELEGCVMCQSLDEAVNIAEIHKETELFITGGGSIYEQAMQLADKIYLTRIHAVLDADTYFPQLPEGQWTLASSEFHVKDEKNIYDYSFMVYNRI